MPALAGHRLYQDTWSPAVRCVLQLGTVGTREGTDGCAGHYLDKDFKAEKYLKLCHFEIKPLRLEASGGKTKKKGSMGNT